MPRALLEWIGKTPDTPVPPRVKLSVLDRQNYRCAGCTRKITAGERWHCDHVIALINGGANRESNLQYLCSWCHEEKTANDVAIKSTVARKRKKHYGIGGKKWRPLLGTIASGWKRYMSGAWERR